MQGTMLIYDAAGALDDPPQRTELSAPPGLEALQGAVGGYIELVPYFRSIVIDGQMVECIAFCNEYGKREQLKINRRATLLWGAASLRSDNPLVDADGNFKDVLVGPVVVIIGDRDLLWMEGAHPGLWEGDDYE